VTDINNFLQKGSSFSCLLIGIEKFDMLSQHMLPAIRDLAGDQYVFQQDSAPAHRARATLEFLQQKVPAFISPELWPPNSPDLNPVDYKIWGCMQERVKKKPIRDLAHLKQRLVEVWAAFEQTTVDKAIDQWRKRLRACVKAKGQHFEHTL
jgi:hypothetical protein